VCFLSALRESSAVENRPRHSLKAGRFGTCPKKRDSDLQPTPERFPVQKPTQPARLFHWRGPYSL
jgi:hypothetical protein